MKRLDDTTIQRPISKPRNRPYQETFIKPGIDTDSRNRMIAEAAYYRAESRGFIPGFDLENWLEAEAEINRAYGLLTVAALAD